MVDITDLNQTASDSDRLAAAWINAVRNKLASLDQQLAYATQQINSLKSQLSQAFQTTVLTGLTVQYAAGSVKLPSGIVVAIASGTKTVTASSTSYLWISDSGVVQLTTTRPTIGLEIARITSSATAITEIQNYPIFEIRPAFPSLDGYATTAFVNSREWTIVAVGRKTALQSLPNNATYYTLTWQSIDGTGFDTSGVLTHTGAARKYVFDATVRIDTTAPNSADLAVKISLFKGNAAEQQILGQFETALGDGTISARNVEPLLLNDGETAMIKAYVTSGVSVRVRESYTKCTVWRLPT